MADKPSLTRNAQYAFVLGAGLTCLTLFATSFPEEVMSIAMLYFVATFVLFIYFIVRYTTRTLARAVYDSNSLDWLINGLILFSGILAILHIDNAAAWFPFVGFLFMFAALKDYTVVRKLAASQERARSPNLLYQDKALVHEIAVGLLCIFWGVVLAHIRQQLQDHLSIAGASLVLLYALALLRIYWKEHLLRGGR